MPRVARIVISGSEHHVTERCPHVAASDSTGILDLAAWGVTRPNGGSACNDRMTSISSPPSASVEN